MTTPFIEYRSPVTGSQKLMPIDDTSVQLMHSADQNGNFHFDIVDMTTNDIVRSATPEEVRQAGINPLLFTNSFPAEEELPVDEELPVEEPTE